MHGNIIVNAACLSGIHRENASSSFLTILFSILLFVIYGFLSMSHVFQQSDLPAIIKEKLQKQGCQVGKNSDIFI